MNEQPQGETTKMKYTGADICTRGEYGELVQFGHMDSTGAIYVWDSDTGWIFWTVYQGEDDADWTDVWTEAQP